MKENAGGVTGQHLSLIKNIHCSSTSYRNWSKPPLSECQGINVISSRCLFFDKNDKTYYFDLMIEEATRLKFVKISEVDPDRRLRTHVLVGVDDINNVISILEKGIYQKFSGGTAYSVLADSKVFEDKRYVFIIWKRNIKGERDHIEIQENGHTYAHLIKNRDPLTASGSFRILISKNKLSAFIIELEGVLFDAQKY